MTSRAQSRRRRVPSPVHCTSTKQPDTGVRKWPTVAGRAGVAEGALSSLTIRLKADVLPNG